MPLILTLDPGDPLEATTAIMAALAWPEAVPDQDTFAHAHCALMGNMYRVMAVAIPEWEQTRQNIRPGYLIMERPTVNRLMKLTMARVRKALIVARMARPFLADVILPVPPPLPRDVPGLSLNGVVPYVLGIEGPDDTHNFEQRVFRRSLPVLHMATALEQAISAFETDHGISPALEAFLPQPGLLSWLTREAAGVEEPLLQVRKFKVAADRQIRFRLAD